jgi:hypothetical protein
MSTWPPFCMRPRLCDHWPHYTCSHSPHHCNEMWLPSNHRGGSSWWQQHKRRHLLAVLINRGKANNSNGTVEVDGKSMAKRSTPYILTPQRGTTSILASRAHHMPRSDEYTRNAQYSLHLLITWMILEISSWSLHRFVDTETAFMCG